MNRLGGNVSFPAIPGALVVAPLILLSLFLSACGSIIHGTTQEVSISSAPTGAQVTVDNIPLGPTPVFWELKRKDNHIVRITLDGYEPYEMVLARSVSGWVVGNILFGGVVGLAVDAISGGMYKLTPEQVNAELVAAGPQAPEMLDSNGLAVLVVLRPRPEWEPIAMLERE